MTYREWSRTVNKLIAQIFVLAVIVTIAGIVLIEMIR